MPAAQLGLFHRLLSKGSLFLALDVFLFFFFSIISKICQIIKKDPSKATI